MSNSLIVVKSRFGYEARHDNRSPVLYGGQGDQGGVSHTDLEAVLQAAIDNVDKPGTVTVHDIDFKMPLDNAVNIPEEVIVYENFHGKVTIYSNEKGEGHYHLAQDLIAGVLNSDRIPSHGSTKHTETYLTEETDPSVHSSLKGVTKTQIQDHSPQVHYHTESQITDLSHDAQKIKGKVVDDSSIDDGKVLGYDEAEDKIVFKDPTSGGMAQHGNEYHTPDFLTEETDPTVDSSLKGVTKSQIQDHDPKTHSHLESEVTNLVTDLASKETPSGSQAKVDAHKDVSTGVHGVGAGTISKVGDIAVDSNLSTAAQDAVSKKHSHSNQTLLDSYTQTEVNLADAVSKRHTQVHGTADHTGTIGTPTQVGLANVTNDAQLKRSDGDLNSLTLKGTPVSADILVIEDSTVSFAKKKITIGSLPAGGESENVVRTASDLTNSTTTFANVTGLTFAIGVNEDYIFEAWIIFQSNTATTGIKFAINGPASPTAVVIQTRIPISLVSVTLGGARAYDSGTASASVDTINSNLLAHIVGIIRNGSSSGTFAIRFAAETTGIVKVMTGSVLRYRKVA
jgi:hypothetical protein